jgi:hypothetical protein
MWHPGVVEGLHKVWKTEQDGIDPKIVWEVAILVEATPHAKSNFGMVSSNIGTRQKHAKLKQCLV